MNFILDLSEPCISLFVSIIKFRLESQNAHWVRSYLTLGLEVVEVNLIIVDVLLWNEYVLYCPCHLPTTLDSEKDLTKFADKHMFICCDKSMDEVLKHLRNLLYTFHVWSENYKLRLKTPKLQENSIYEYNSVNV